MLEVLPAVEERPAAVANPRMVSAVFWSMDEHLPDAFVDLVGWDGDVDAGPDV
jgi:hypothetical protein